MRKKNKKQIRIKLTKKTPAIPVFFNIENVLDNLFDQANNLYLRYKN